MEKKGLPPDAIQMSFERIFCARHGEPLKPSWPSGYAIMMVGLFDEVFRKRDTLAEAVAATGDERPDPQIIEALLDVTPACCRVSSEILLRLYNEADFGVVAKCRGCRRKRMGAHYRFSHQAPGHICFECVVHNMEPMH